MEDVPKKEETQKKEETPKKETAKSQLGLAAIIASVGIPVAQLLVGYLGQRTTQLENNALERERRRVEVTKLFLDNYIDKKADVQIATIQIMKSLDPAFFISIEDGLKETTRSDTVRASLRRAAVEAATELSSDPLHSKNKKVQKVLSSRAYENQGFDHLFKGDFKNAKESFQQSDEEWHDLNGINTKVLSNEAFEKFNSAANKKEMQKELLKNLYDNYSYSLSDSMRRALKKKMKE